MRGVTIGASVVAHVAVFALAAHYLTGHDDQVERSRTAAPIIELVPPAEITVTLLAEPAPSAVAPASGAGGARSVVRSTATVVPEPPATPAPGTEAPRVNPLAMRGSRHDLRLPEATAREIVGTRAAAAAGAEQGESRWAYDPKLELQPDGGGKLVLRDPVATVNVAPDGTVDLKSTPYFAVKLNLPTPSLLRRELDHAKRDLAAWYADPFRDMRVGSAQDLPEHLRAVPGSCDHYGDPNCFTAADQKKVWAAEDEARMSKGGPLVAIKADITGYLMNKFVGDPYASRKLKILDQSRAQRVELGTAYRADQARRSAELVQRNLEALWRTTSDPAERRAALFAIWDECGEDEAGERARAMVIGWIHKRIPAGSPDAFTPAEIDALDAQRTSRQHFRP
jgi:hypothetical protein